MWQRGYSITSTLMSLALLTILAKPSPAFINCPECESNHSSAGDSARSVRLTLPALISKDKVLESAYHNTLAILSTSNGCSDFFGGPSASTWILNQLVSQVRKNYISPSIAMRMEGPTTNAYDVRTRARYRLFSKVSLNTNGPFYKRDNSRWDRSVFRVGTFVPNTRQVRVLILLHELGHVMKGQDGKWLLPDDGGNEHLSRSNSNKIAEVCGEQIRGLAEGDASRNLTMRNGPDERPASDRDNPSSLP